MHPPGKQQERSDLSGGYWHRAHCCSKLFVYFTYILLYTKMLNILVWLFRKQYRLSLISNRIFPGTASVARAWTANFDALPFVNKTIENYMRDCCSMNATGLAEWPDVLSFAIIFILTCKTSLYSSSFGIGCHRHSKMCQQVYMYIFVILK